MTGSKAEQLGSCGVTGRKLRGRVRQKEKAVLERCCATAMQAGEKGGVVALMLRVSNLEARLAAEVDDEAHEGCGGKGIR